jgi:hypothetical protein
VTRQGTYILTAVAVALFLLLNWTFADGLFIKNFWNSEDITASAIWTYVLLGLIVLAGVVQAQRLPPAGVSTSRSSETETPGRLEDPRTWRRLMGNA